MKYAIIQSNIVQTVVVWDGISRWRPPQGTELLQLADGEPCGGGWAYEAGATPRFSEPVVEVEEET